MRRSVVAISIASLAVMLLLSPWQAVAQSDAVNQLQATVVSLYERLSQSVVNITNQAVSFDSLQGPAPEVGTGSGFIYDRQGLIVTNYHVVENAQTLTVTLSNGKTYPAKKVGEDSTNDLAVIRIQAPSLPDALPIGDPSTLKVGQFVLAIGSPFGLQQTLTMGVISALGRIIQSPDGRFIGEAIQTDAAINPGNSGGPMIDLQGRVIGVNSQILSPSGASSGIGFAISSATVRRVVPQLVAHGRYAHPFLGIQGLDLGSDLTQALAHSGQAVNVDSGIYVAQVTPGSPADKGGMKGGSSMVYLSNGSLPVGGDVVTAVNGQDVKSFGELTAYLESRTTVGDNVTITVSRGGRSMTLNVRLGERPAPPQ